MLHRMPVILLVCFALVLPTALVASEDGESRYLGPVDIVASRDGSLLYVACYDASTLLVVDTTGAKLRQIKLPARPTGLCISQDGKLLFVTCAAPAGFVQIVNTQQEKLLQRIPVGYWACGPAVSPDGSRLYVCNRFENSVSVVDLGQSKEVARIPVVREPIQAAVSPDGKTVFVANFLPLDRADSFDVAAVISAISTEDHSVQHIRLLNGSSGVRSVCVSPDGQYVYAVHLLARYQLPTTQLERGWMNTNALSIIDAREKKLINTVLLDDVDLGAANPWDVHCSDDGRFICVSHAGTHEVSVIDREKLHAKLAEIPADPAEARKLGRYDQPGVYTSVIQADVPNDLAFLVGIRQRIRIQGRGVWGWLGADRTEANGPRGLAWANGKIYVCAYFSDRLAAIDPAAHPTKQVTYIDLGPKPKLTPERYGEMNFNDAWLCFQHWQSCASCHPEGRVDGLNWDLLNDGIGNPKNVRSLVLAHETPPAMASGVRPTAEDAVRAGFERILFTVQPEEILDSVNRYLRSLKPLPSPHLVDGELSPAARRGRKLFFSERVGCAVCHPEPLYTDQLMHDVGSRSQLDRRDAFDTPTLIECWRTAPYMHDGHYLTIEELLIEGKHGLKEHNIQLTEQEIKDLAEFVLSL